MKIYIHIFTAGYPVVGQVVLIVEVSKLRSEHTRIGKDSSGRVIGSSQEPRPDETQPSQTIDIHAPGGIRIRNPSKREATDPHLRPHGHWDRYAYTYIHIIFINQCSVFYFRGTSQ